MLTLVSLTPPRYLGRVDTEGTFVGALNKAKKIVAKKVPNLKAKDFLRQKKKIFPTRHILINLQTSNLCLSKIFYFTIIFC